MNNFDSALRQLGEARQALDEQTRMIRLIESFDISMVQGITVGSAGLILRVIGWPDYHRLHRQLDTIGAIPERLAIMDSGSRHTIFKIDGIGSPSWWGTRLTVINEPDKEVCDLVKVGERVEPIYEARCH